jgi:hypothetical protein
VSRLVVGLMALSWGPLAVGLVAVAAHQEQLGAQQYEQAVQPLKVTLYEGRDCLQDSGVLEDVVLTNDDADERLQHCSGGVTWKELRR